MARRYEGATREAGRPRANWDKDPAFVRQWLAWAIRDGQSPATIKSGRSRATSFHRFLVSRHGRDYYRPDHGVDKITWEDAHAYKQHLIARVDAGDIAPKTGVNLWADATSWYQWRAKFDPNDASAVDTWKRVELFVDAKDFPAGEDLESGSGPYELEDFHKVVDAARSTHVREDYPDEDYHLVLLGAYTGQRTMIIGLRWQDVQWDDPDPRQHVIVARTKGGKMKRFPLLAPLEAILRDLRARNPDQRMVFTATDYPWDDKLPATGQCEYGYAGKRCRETEDLKLHFGRERDEAYCRPHHLRNLSAARGRNQGVADRCMARVEAVLREKYPELTEEIMDRRTGQSVRAPIHVHWHRFRKTLGTWYQELGLPEELVAKVVGWRELSTLREKYHRPARRRLYEAASKVDLVDASRRAAAGEDVGVKSELETVVEVLRQELQRSREENERLRASFADLAAQLRSGTVRVDVGP